ncbi:MAG: MFS transporter [Actinomycetota bacterium]|nr:MFS transporter [Actinomycetota bacterium]
MLIGARAVQGVGAALLLPGTLAIITHAFPGKGEQARAIGIWAGVGSVALPAGPLFGGALIAGFGWRAVFLINVPVVAVAGVVTARVVTETIGDPHRRLDRTGVIAAGVFLTAVTFAFIQAGHSGLGLPVVAAIVVAVAAAVVFVAVERSRSDPMLPLRLFTRRDFSTANTVAGVMNLGTLGLLFLLTLYLQTVQHRSALAAGVAVLPLFAPSACWPRSAAGSLPAWAPRCRWPSVWSLPRRGPARPSPAALGVPDLLPAMLAWGVGLGLLTPAVVAAAVGAVDADRAGLASGVNNTFRQAGGAIGIAAFGALAGAPTATQSFVTGFRHAGLLTAALFAAATVAAITLIPSKPLGE